MTPKTIRDPKMAPALHLLDGPEDPETKTRRNDKQPEANKQAYAAGASFKAGNGPKNKKCSGGSAQVVEEA
jgi:hypothetical protein